MSSYTKKEENLIKRAIEELKKYAVPQNNYTIFESFDYIWILEQKERMEKNGYWAVAPTGTVEIRKKDLYILVMSER